MSEALQPQLFEHASMADQIALDLSVEAAMRPDLLPLRTSVGDFYVGALMAGAEEVDAIEASIVAADMVRTGEASSSDSYLRLGALVVLQGRVGKNEKLSIALGNIMHRLSAGAMQQPTLWSQQ